MNVFACCHSVLVGNNLFCFATFQLRAIGDEVHHVYVILRLFLGNAVRNGQIPLVGGDFNACIGEAEECDHVEFIGPCGMGKK